MEQKVLTKTHWESNSCPWCVILIACQDSHAAAYCCCFWWKVIFVCLLSKPFEMFENICCQFYLWQNSLRWWNVEPFQDDDKNALTLKTINNSRSIWVMRRSCFVFAFRVHSKTKYENKPRKHTHNFNTHLRDSVVEKNSWLQKDGMMITRWKKMIDGILITFVIYFFLFQYFRWRF